MWVGGVDRGQACSVAELCSVEVDSGGAAVVGGGDVEPAVSWGVSFPKIFGMVVDAEIDPLIGALVISQIEYPVTCCGIGSFTEDIDKRGVIAVDPGFCGEGGG